MAYLTDICCRGRQKPATAASLDGRDGGIRIESVSQRFAESLSRY
jgi:hypothetical protein